MRGSQRMKIIRICVLALLILTIGGYAAFMVMNRSDGGEPPSFTSTADKIMVSCEYSDTDLLRGLTASDKEDGDLTDEIIVGNFSEFKSRGTADLDYAVYDSDGNCTTFTREVRFTDYSPPKITFYSPLVFYAKGSSNVAMRQYAEAYDALDGNITKRVKITGTDADFDVVGEYTVSVYVKNSLGDEVNIDFPVHILDPADKGDVMSLKSYVVYIDKGEKFTPEEYFDEVTAPNTGAVRSPESYTLKIDSEVDTAKDGVYEVHYSAVSSAEQTSASAPSEDLIAETWLTVVVGEYGG